VWNPFPAPASRLEHPVNPSKQIAGTVTSNRREVFLLIDIRFFMYQVTGKTIGCVDYCYDELSQILIDRAWFERDREQLHSLSRPDDWGAGIPVVGPILGAPSPISSHTPTSWTGTPATNITNPAHLWSTSGGMFQRQMTSR
jgi:hypothetical protein